MMQVLKVKSESAKKDRKSEPTGLLFILAAPMLILGLHKLLANNE